tara:strand:- start:494 stop:883 length:390 start_codon:yes stop_codon:yes gene_type:complete
MADPEEPRQSIPTSGLVTTFPSVGPKGGTLIVKKQKEPSGVKVMEEDLKPGDDHEYALDLIRNLMTVTSNELDSRILMEVMMVYSISWNMANGDIELISDMFPLVLSRIEDGSYQEVIELINGEERICH